MTQKLPQEFAGELDAATRDWTASGKVSRLWNRDKSLWTNADEDKWLGWLDIAERSWSSTQLFADIAQQAKAGGYRDAVVLGMGGSSLCPGSARRDVRASRTAFPPCTSSIRPIPRRSKPSSDQPIRRLRSTSSPANPAARSSPISSSIISLRKSGRDGSRFIAVTDPGSKMEQVAKADRFSRICYGVPSIGGRYSALSDFGMVPGAAAGLDIPRLLARASEMAKHMPRTGCGEEPRRIPWPRARLCCPKHGHDKVTLIASPAIYDLGAWLEQLIAESTGKNRTRPDSCGSANRRAAGRLRQRPHLRLYPLHAVSSTPTRKKRWPRSRKQGTPSSVSISRDQYDLGAEFFRWEIAVAVAGAVIGINPFDQPDVEASKIATRKLTDEYEKTGKLPPEAPILEADGLKFFTDARNAAELKGKTAAAILRVPSGPHPAGRLLRAARLHPDEPGA